MVGCAVVGERMASVSVPQVKDTYLKDRRQGRPSPGSPSIYRALTHIMNNPTMDRGSGVEEYFIRVWERKKLCAVS